MWRVIPVSRATTPQTASQSPALSANEAPTIRDHKPFVEVMRHAAGKAV